MNESSMPIRFSHGKPLPVRQRHFEKPARVATPAVLAKTTKKTTSKKDQAALFSRWATGSVQQTKGFGRPVREKKARRD